MLGGAVTDVDGAYYGANATSAATGLTSCAPPGFNAVTTAATGTGVPGGGSPVGAVQCGHPADKLGWVATGGLRLNVPGGSYFQMQGSYTQGALRYISHTQWPTGSAARFGVGNSLGVGSLMDAIFGQSGELELTRAWGVYASWEQVWNPKWKTSLYGGWTSVSATMTTPRRSSPPPPAATRTAHPPSPRASSSAQATSPLNAMASGSLANMTNCDPNWQMGYVGTRTQWNITSQFYMGVDVLYTKLYTAFSGLGGAALGQRAARPGSTPSRTRTTGP